MLNEKRKKENDNQVMIAKPYLSLEETAEYLSYQKSSIYQFTSKKLIPHYKIRKKLLFKISELNEFIENHKVHTNAEIKQQAINDYVLGRD
jgi:excisionase family DNA binding protein